MGPNCVGLTRNSFSKHQCCYLCLQGGVTSSSSAGSLSAMMTPQGFMSPANSPGPRLKVQQPMPTSDTRPNSGKQIQVEAAPARVATPPSMPAATPQAAYSPRAAYSTAAPQATFSNAGPTGRAAYNDASPQALNSSAAPQPYSSYSMPEPPAPRSWTPSKLGSSGGKHFQTGPCTACCMTQPMTFCLRSMHALARAIVDKVFRCLP